MDMKSVGIVDVVVFILGKEMITYDSVNGGQSIQ